ncbi:MAG: methyltransferase domain-containing protein [Thermomonas sp.]
MNDGANERDIRAYEAAYASTYDFESVQVRFRRGAVLGSLGARMPRRVVEIGCGMEPLLPHYLASGNTIDSWVVVEPAPMFAQAARDAGKDCAGMVVIEGFFGDEVADRIGGEHGLADMVVCSGLLHEVGDPMGLLHAIRKVMAHDALVHVNVPNASSLHRRLAKAMGLIQELEALSERNVELQQHRVYSLASLHRDLQAAGLRPVEDGGILMKPFTHAQMSTMVEALGSDILAGLAVLGREIPELSSEIFVNATAETR